MADDDAFLSRWSRRKALVRQGVQPPEPARAAEPPAPAAQTAAPPAPPVPAGALAADPVAERPPAPTLDDVAQLTPDAPDFSRFVQPGVGSEVKNAALKKLFADPHFNVMDGLDIYIDDYSKPDPLPPEMLRQMVQGRFLGLFDDEPKDAAAAQAAGATTAAPPPEVAPSAAVEGGHVPLTPDDPGASPVGPDLATSADARLDTPAALPDLPRSDSPPAA